MTELRGACAIRRVCFTLWLLLFALGLLLYGKAVSAAAVNSLSLCMQVLLPALFPFFVLSGWLALSGGGTFLCCLLDKPMRQWFGLSGSCASALLLGWIGGYPVGASTAVQLYQNRRCSREEALSLLRFCNNAGPAFLIAAFGNGMLQSSRDGATIYGAQLLSSLFIGVLFRRKTGAVKHLTRHENSQNSPYSLTLSALLSTVKNAFDAFQGVCAFVVFFAVTESLLLQLPPMQGGGLGAALFSGLLELTGGLSMLAKLQLKRQLLLPCCAFLSGFGGLSVTLQSVSLILDAGLPCKGYLKSKLMQGFIAAVITFLLVSL